MNKVIYGFPKVKYPKNVVDSLTDRQKQEYALEDEDIIIFDDIDQFLCNLNSNLLPNCNEVLWTAVKQ